MFCFLSLLATGNAKAVQRRSIAIDIVDDVDTVLLTRGRRSTIMLNFLSNDGSSWSYGQALLAFLQQGNYASGFSSASLATATATADCKQ